MAVREQLVMDTFVDLADTLATDDDIGEFLQMLGSGARRSSRSPRVASW